MNGIIIGRPSKKGCILDYLNYPYFSLINREYRFKEEEYGKAIYLWKIDRTFKDKNSDTVLVCSPLRKLAKEEVENLSDKVAALLFSQQEDCDTKYNLILNNVLNPIEFINSKGNVPLKMAPTSRDLYLKNQSLLTDEYVKGNLNPEFLTVLLQTPRFFSMQDFMHDEEHKIHKILSDSQESLDEVLEYPQYTLATEDKRYGICSLRQRDLHTSVQESTVGYGKYFTAVTNYGMVLALTQNELLSLPKDKFEIPFLFTDVTEASLMLTPDSSMIEKIYPIVYLGYRNTADIAVKFKNGKTENFWTIKEYLLSHLKDLLPDFIVNGEYIYPSISTNFSLPYVGRDITLSFTEKISVNFEFDGYTYTTLLPVSIVASKLKGRCTSHTFTVLGDNSDNICVKFKSVEEGHSSLFES